MPSAPEAFRIQIPGDPVPVVKGPPVNAEMQVGPVTSVLQGVAAAQGSEFPALVDSIPFLHGNQWTQMSVQGTEPGSIIPAVFHHHDSAPAGIENVDVADPSRSDGDHRGHFLLPADIVSDVDGVRKRSSPVCKDLIAVIALFPQIIAPRGGDQRFNGGRMGLILPGKRIPCGLP
jgi:hypothetical protein